MTKNPRKTQKSRSGCLTCKRRRLKCDEEVPSCRRCVKLGVQCPGYTKPMKWSTKYEKQLVIPSIDGNSQTRSSEWFEEGAKKVSEAIKSSPKTKGAEKPTTPSALLPCAINSPSISTSSTTTPTPSEVEDGCENDDTSTDDFSMALSDISSLINVSPGFSFADNTPSLASHLQNHELPRLLDAPADQSSILLDHYFTFICRINSCFDSIHNPFRSEISGMIAQSPLLYYCILSMSAAHLYRNEADGFSVSLKFQTEAISHLSNELSNIDIQKPKLQKSVFASIGVVSNSANLVKDDVLLGIILLGMTSAWHDSSSLGLSHLRGSRPLFQSWMSVNNLDRNNTLSFTPRQSFILSSMVYWEALTSFLVDQETEALSYLDVFLRQHPLSTVYPSPWTGVGTTIFICLAKTGTLLRKKRLLNRLRLFKSSRSHRDQLYSQLANEACSLVRDINDIRLPFISLIEETGDPHATPDHFLRTARCYRLAALLELYRAFPEIIGSATEIDQTEYLGPSCLGKQAQIVLGLTVSALDMLQSIPDDSNTISTQNLLLLITGSALAQVSCAGDDTSPLEQKLNHDVMRQREFVRNRLVQLHMYIGLRPIMHAALILEEVWARMDLAAESGTGTDYRDKIFSDQVHWMDIMSEKRLETIMG